MRDSTPPPFWRVVDFFRMAAAVGHVVVLVVAHNGKCGSRSIPILTVLVASPVSAQAAHGGSNGTAILFAIFLISAPALVGVVAHRVIRLWVYLRNEAIFFRLCLRLRHKTKSSRQFISLAPWANQVTEFGKANITTIAVPLIDEWKPRRGKIRLVGGDGSYFTGDNKEKLRRALRRWIIDDMMEVEYLLMKPHADVVEALKKFAETDLVGSADKLSVFVLEDYKNLPEGAKRLADFLGTYHPNLISWPVNDEIKHRAMWLEGMHMPGKDVSYDNRWIPPRSMSSPVSRTIHGPTWEDTFHRWDKALDDLKQDMVAQ